MVHARPARVRALHRMTGIAMVTAALVAISGCGGDPEAQETMDPTASGSPSSTAQAMSRHFTRATSSSRTRERSRWRRRCSQLMSTYISHLPILTKAQSESIAYLARARSQTGCGTYFTSSRMRLTTRARSWPVS